MGKKETVTLGVSPLVQMLEKSPKDFSWKDLVKCIEKCEIKFIDFHYVGGDGRIKTLNFAVQSREQLKHLLLLGERVDGSSLFPYLESGKSDLYVVPQLSTAFLNTFSQELSLGIFCRYFDQEGNPFDYSPDNILFKADQAFKEETGLQLWAMGELEYYIIYPKEELYLATNQKGYHESTPFIKFEQIKKEAIMHLTAAGAEVKYAHSEVGNFSDEKFTYEQNEIEFIPTTLEKAANSLLLAKWILRNLAYKYNVQVSFSPKISLGKAGSGLHIHLQLRDLEGKNVVLENKTLSEYSQKAIAGILKYSSALTAFGNPVPISYLRLVPNQEAPTKVCWGDFNRSALIRVPLSWSNEYEKMIKTANPQAKIPDALDTSIKPTFEFRVPDGAANVHLLLAGIAAAAREGLMDSDSLDFAEKTYVNVNIFLEENKHIAEKLSNLPTCCYESAQALASTKEIFLKHNVFPEKVLNYTIKQLESYNDCTWREKLASLSEEERNEELKKAVLDYINIG